MSDPRSRANAYQKFSTKAKPSNDGHDAPQEAKDRGAIELIGKLVQESEPVSPEKRGSQAASRAFAQRPEVVARYLIAIGPDQASAIVKHLPQEVVEQIAATIAAQPPMKANERVAAIEAMAEVLSQISGTTRGGKGAAEDILARVYGPEGAKERMAKLKLGSENPFAFLENYNGNQIYQVIKEEPPSVKALIFGRLPAALAAEILGKLDSDQRAEVMLRLGKASAIAPEILDRVAEALKKRIERVGTSAEVEIQGRSALTNILKHMGPDQGEELLNRLEDEDQELASEIREELITLETTLRLQPRDLEQILRQLDDKEIALMLKGQEERVRAHILRHVSASRAQLIAEEYKYLGPVRRKDARDAVGHCIRIIRSQLDSGSMVLMSDDDEYIQ